MRQSGCEVSDWLLKLPNPSKQLKKNLRRRPVERKDIRAAGSGAVGRKDAQKRKDMVEGSKRRKIKNAEAAQKGASAKDGAAPEKVGAEQA